MRVKITYTVGIEEVPKEVAEIMTRATNDLDEAYQEVVKIQTELDNETGQVDDHLKSIDLARRKMFAADQTLQDCQAILLGLKDVVEKTEEKENEIQDG